MDAKRDKIVAGSSTLKPKAKRRNHNGERLSRKSVSDTDRERIVNAYLNGFKAKTISEMLDVKLFTVYTILKQYQKTGKVAALKRGGNHKKLLSDDASASIRKWLEEDSNLSLGTLTDRVWEQYHVRVCRSTVAREIKRLNVPWRLRFNIEATRKKFHAFVALDASQNESNSAVGYECPLSVKEEYSNSSEKDDFDVGETILMCANGEKETVEPCNAGYDFAEKSAINESDIGENHLSENDYTSFTKIQSMKDPLQTTASKSCTLQTLDESKIFKAVTIPLPSQNKPMGKIVVRAGDSDAQAPAVIDSNSINGSLADPLEESAANASKSCTHCICFNELISEQKKMFAQLLNFQQKVVNEIQEVKQSVAQKLKDIEEVVKHVKK